MNGARQKASLLEEDDLRNSETRLTQAEKVAKVGNWTLNLGSKIIIASRGADLIYGVDFGTIPLADVQKIPLPEYRPALDKALADLIAKNIPYDQEFKICRPLDGAIVDIHSVATFDKNTNTVFGVIQDITERKATEKALSDSELKYRSLIESSSDAIFCVDEKGEYKFTNYLFASTFGKTADYFIGKTFWDVYPKEHADYRFEATKRVFQTGKSESLEVEVPLPDRTLYFYATATPIKDKTGKVILSLTNATDITERKLAEDKVKLLLAEKELILKEVHHRIKNNMNTIASLLSLQLGTVSDSSAASALEDASNRVQSMSLLYDKLYRSADFTNVPVSEYLGELVDEVIENFPNCSLVRTEKHLQDFILDAKRLQPLGIIINELLTNIMKYAFTGRSAGIIVVSATNNDGCVAISVQDDGNGIPESVSFKNPSGFGLQLVEALTEQLKGTIRIERGRGTKVVLEFLYPEARNP